MIFDQHIHSYYSLDSEAPIKEYLDKVKELGVSYFVVTDHLDLSFCDLGHDWSFDIKKQKEELISLQNEYKDITLLQGIEIGYKPSRLDDIKRIVKENDFDVINFSVHEVKGKDVYHIDDFIKLGIKKTMEMTFEVMLEALASFDDFDVFTHIDYAFKTVYLNDKSAKINEYEDALIKVMKAVIKKDKCLEINTKVQELLPIEHTKYILDLYKRCGGINITLSSDAHKADRLCSSFDKYIPIIKEMGFNHLSYFIKRKRYSYSI